MSCSPIVSLVCDILIYLTMTRSLYGYIQLSVSLLFFFLCEQRFGNFTQSFLHPFQEGEGAQW